ncbi:glycoside hydrolase family 32 protein [Cohnella sp.]|uniref:glycoside hydrolase family 32 protein n=1 Tax=Cohnella sp. TaxID=1883426 RepID=UPI003561B158
MKHQERVTLANKALTNPALTITEDRYRLQYHLMPPIGWMNDPNGLIYRNGEYHVFYQHYPYAPKQGPMYWGHAKSADLISWEHLPIALAPSEPYDFVEDGTGGGCWSGSAAEQDGTFILIYTGHVDGKSPEEVQCLATSEDGIHFEKAAFNPVIDSPPEDGGFGFRDPKVWKHGDIWNMVIGYGKDGKGKALFYQSADLWKWNYVSVAAESDGTMGNMWECPDLFPLGDGDRHVLIISPMNMGETKTMYLSGMFDYSSGVLQAEYAERLDYGFDFYAPQTLLDDQGRRILIGWMNIWGSSMPEKEDRWMGAMTIPREVKALNDGTIRMEPVAELMALRRNHYIVAPQVILADSILSLPDIQGDSLEMIAVFEVNESNTDAEFGIRVRCSQDNLEYTEVCYQASEKKLLVDRNHSGSGDGGISEASLEPMGNGSLKLHLFIDKSSLELFANEGVKTITNRIYPDSPSLGIHLFSRKGNAVLQSLDVWELDSIW